MRVSPAHALGMIAKVLAAIVVWGLSIGFSYAFFVSIAPPDSPYFPYMGIGLTEGGFILWMVVFLCTNHSAFAKIIALVMACASAATSLTLAGTQFYSILAAHLDLQSVKWLYPTVSIALVTMFGLNCLVVVIELVAWYFAQPGHEFFGPKQGDLIPINSQHGNLIPTNGYSIQELQSVQDAITGYLASVGGSDVTDPLASRQLPRPQETMTLAQMGTAVKEGANSVMQKVSGFTKRGKKAAIAPGAQNETTGESTPTKEPATSEAKDITVIRDNGTSYTVKPEEGKDTLIIRDNGTSYTVKPEGN